jgi:hypothetical protein
VRANLHEVRMAELQASVDALGYASLHMQGYRDSGMPDTDENKDPGNFANAPLDEAVGRFARIIRAGRHLSRPKRYTRGLPIDVEDESQLPEAVAVQARRGDGWVKLVGDWIDREVGDLAPLWSDDVLKRAIDTAHALGARVTAHVFGEDALPGLVNAGIDCIEHGSGHLFDFLIQDESGNKLYRWSDDRMFIALMMTTEIAPGEEIVFSDALDAETYASIKDRIASVKAYIVGTSSDFTINPDGYFALVNGLSA